MPSLDCHPFTPTESKSAAPGSVVKELSGSEESAFSRERMGERTPRECSGLFKNTVLDEACISLGRWKLCWVRREIVRMVQETDAIP